MKHYNMTTPPEYDLTKVNVPTAFIYAENDWLTNPRVDRIHFNEKFLTILLDCLMFIFFLFQDVEMFYQFLPMKRGLFKVDLKEFNHIDFLYAIDAPALVYVKILYLLDFM